MARLRPRLRQWGREGTTRSGQRVSRPLVLVLLRHRRATGPQQAGDWDGVQAAQGVRVVPGSRQGLVTWPNGGGATSTSKKRQKTSRKSKKKKQEKQKYNVSKNVKKSKSFERFENRVLHSLLSLGDCVWALRVV